uniref:Uncharacterized protein n=1 Tax=Firmicutes phage HS08 TaxID=3056391 RepID=A0AA49X3B4_9VIRU|nr:MAG: hypothetical protein [Firmicutes phage HS08]
MRDKGDFNLLLLLFLLFLCDLKLGRRIKQYIRCPHVAHIKIIRLKFLIIIKYEN